MDAKVGNYRTQRQTNEELRMQDKSGKTKADDKLEKNIRMSNQVVSPPIRYGVSGTGYPYLSGTSEAYN